MPRGSGQRASTERQHGLRPPPAAGGCRGAAAGGLGLDGHARDSGHRERAAVQAGRASSGDPRPRCESRLQDEPSPRLRGDRLWPFHAHVPRSALGESGGRRHADEAERRPGPQLEADGPRRSARSRRPHMVLQQRLLRQPRHALANPRQGGVLRDRVQRQ